MSSTTLAPESGHSIRARRFPRWLYGVGTLLLVILLIQFGVSLVFQKTTFRALLDERLELAFGRPIQVGSYSFSLWMGPELEAHSVTVADDPRFGYEYFLRAQTLSARLRWQSLLLGRFELGTLSIAQPSLNLVRTADGQWNVEAWLPRPPNATPGGTSAPISQRPLLRRIEVDSGRVNFKRGVEKLAFAFVDVTGFVEQEGQGTWRIQLKARPYRAATILQQTGFLGIEGRLGGTSSRLRPADLNITWNDASLSDILRLTRGNDYGVRGGVSMSLHAQTQAAPWDLEGLLRLTGVHRWDLPGLPDNPALNLRVGARWWPEQSRIDVTRALVEAPASRARVEGVLDWNVPRNHGAAGNATRIQVLSSGVQFSDLLRWIRAFRVGIDDTLSIGGQLGVDVALSGWPPRIAHGAFATDGAILASRQFSTVRVGRTAVEVEPGNWHLLPTGIAFRGDLSPLRVEAAIEHPNDGWLSSGSVFGSLANAHRLLEIAHGFGWSLPPGWTFEGPARVDLHWHGAPFPSINDVTGTIETTSLSLGAPFLNDSIRQIKGRFESKAGGQKITLAAAQAFGAHWTGTLNRLRPAAEWQFALKADHLASIDLSAWLDPEYRRGLLERVFPFLTSPAPASTMPVKVRGQGTLDVRRFDLGSLALGDLHADLAVNGREIDIVNGHGSFYDGQVQGSLAANLTQTPGYDVHAKFKHVDLSLITSAGIAGSNFGGRASGDIAFHASGIGRTALLQSLECSGQAQVENGTIQGMDLPASLRESSVVPGDTEFPHLEADFDCKSGKLEFSDLHMVSASANYDAVGSVDFARTLDFHLRVLPLGSREPGSMATDASDSSFHLTGPLSNWQMTLLGPDQANHSSRPRMRR